jgi:hypothetical protein
MSHRVSATFLFSALILISGCTPVAEPDPNPYGPGMGKISFWTSANIPGGIGVSVGSSSIGNLTQYFPDGTPSCGQSGTVSTIISAGTHSFAAQSSGGITWGGTVDVEEGECINYQLTYSGNTNPNVPSTISGRPVSVLGTVTVKRANVQMCVWDHGTIDGDIITLIVNGSSVISSYTLTASKRCVNVTLNPAGYSYVALYAHNEGSISPNTAALSISDGVTGEQTFQLEATLQTNGAYNIKVQP